jgi:hypothetical protein
VFILARPTAHANKLTLTLSTGPHAQLDTSYSFDNRPHIAVARSIARIVPRAHVITVAHSVRECCRILSRLDVTGEGWIRVSLMLSGAGYILCYFFRLFSLLHSYLHSPVTFGYPVIPPVVLF